MREIKFRAYYKGIASGYIIEGEYTMKDLTDRGIKFCQTSITWAEYTGLKDCKGKEIYEGDIVKTSITTEAKAGEDFDYYNTDEHDNRTKMSCSHKPASVKYGDSGYYFEHASGVKKPFWVCTKDIKGESEIIGNVYENPELLEAL